jgi:hypothetical protein
MGETPGDGKSPNTSAAAEFLRRWSSGPWVLTAITPDKKSILTETFHAIKDAEAWIGMHNGKRNLYFHVNPVTRDLHKKAEREDIAALAWLHVDIDPRVGEDLTQERERALDLLENPRGGVPKPTVIIFSGGGYQGFWKLRDPLRIDGDLAKAEEAKLYNVRLEMVFGADRCHNVDRIMRLPGTINIPDAKKRNKGRTETLATLHLFDDERVYDLEQFEKAPRLQLPGEKGIGPTEPVRVSGNVRRLARVTDLDEWDVPARVQAMIVQGHLRDSEGSKKGDDSRSAWLFDAVCQLVRCSVPDEVIFSVITDPDFGISASVVERGSRAERYALKQIASAKDHAIHPRLRELNERYAVIRNYGGKCRVIEEVVDSGFDNRPRLTKQTFGDFKNAYNNEHVDIGTEKKPVRKSLGEWWLTHPLRRQYDYVVFAPGREVAGAYNLWHGFAVEPSPGDCSMFLAHARENICAGNTEYFDYLIGWMATLVQNPGAPGHVAVVLRGPRGVGKGAFVSHFGHLLGRHYLQVSQASHMVGNFNAHLRNCVLLFADEAFYAGDKRHESVLKALVTEQTIAIEEKGVDVEAAPNFVHLILASNEEWVVPAGPFERRFFVLNVATERMQDLAYFKELDRRMKAGGYSALLQYLQRYDLTAFEVRAVPKTTALAEQQALTLPPVEQVFLDCLREGTIPYHAKVEGSYLVSTEQMAAYVRDRTRKIVSMNRVGTFLGRPPGRGTSLRLHMSFPKHDKKTRSDPPSGFFVPELAEARARWDLRVGPQEWDTKARWDLRDADTTPRDEPPDELPF